MTSIAKPPVRHPGLLRNALGLTRRDYEGAMSTLCAGCGHDSVTAALVEACWELDVPPHGVAKLSGIGCSSKTTAYFLRQSHGFNSVHGRMPSVATGAHAANRQLVCLGISGDGDSLSIGLGQLCHAFRRNPRMLYVLENNGVYGLTKGQFSASADVGSTSKRGEANVQAPIDPVLLALALGATFVARGFSGDKAQLVPILKAGLLHDGLAFVDVISPCVTFNNHDSSTKSYTYSKEHDELLHQIGFVPEYEQIEIDYEPGTVRVVEMHDGSRIVLKKLEEDYDPTDAVMALQRLYRATAGGQMLTGIVHLRPEKKSFMEMLNVTDAPLNTLPLEKTRPPKEALEKIMRDLE